MSLGLYRRARRAAYLLRRFSHPRAIAWECIRKCRPGRALITKLNKDLRVRIYPHDVIGRDIYVHGLFEMAGCRFVPSFLEPGMVFVDVGANLGQYTLWAAKCIGKTGQVHSFEPSGRMFGELEFNVRLNGVSDLDAYVKAQSIDHIDLVKMDIEGAELLALRGGREVLGRADAPVIVLELFDVNTAGFAYQALETWDYLEGFGYRMFEFDRRGRITGLAERPADFSVERNLVARKASFRPKGPDRC